MLSVSDRECACNHNSQCAVTCIVANRCVPPLSPGSLACNRVLCNATVHITLPILACPLFSCLRLRCATTADSDVTEAAAWLANQGFKRERDLACASNAADFPGARGMKPELDVVAQRLWQYNFLPNFRRRRQQTTSTTLPCPWPSGAALWLPGPAACTRHRPQCFRSAAQLPRRPCLFCVTSCKGAVPKLRATGGSLR